MKKMAIVYTEVHDIKDDGIFVKGMTDFEVGYNDVHDVNRKWIWTAPTAATSSASSRPTLIGQEAAGSWSITTWSVP